MNSGLKITGVQITDNTVTLETATSDGEPLHLRFDGSISTAVQLTNGNVHFSVTCMARESESTARTPKNQDFRQ